ncbi:hypothetical protein R3P38DRAFT_2763901 [Favolaschia claudopus]|uniref:Uncharacterized protein n=1 Tax=Favolaschia claudopus TaxID=2862362 RepID=A0AAW0DKH4_9AGAR
MARDLPTFSAEEEDILNATSAAVLHIAIVDDDTPVDFVLEQIHELWKKAARLAYAHGRREGFEEGRAAAQAKASQAASAVTARHQKELEEERVWGYDVGFSLARDIERAHIDAEACSSSHHSSPTTSIATQTDGIIADPIPQSDPHGLSSTSSWADYPPDVLPFYDSSPATPASEKESLPLTHEKVLSTRSPTFIRDFSALSSGDSKPFSSLQRRHRRSPRARCARSSPSIASRTPAVPQTFVLNIYPLISKTARADLRDKRSSPPTRPAPSSTSVDSPTLAWDHDPRLRDLSRALTALGWVRPG